MKEQYSDSLESFRECVAQISAGAQVRRGDCAAAHTLIGKVLFGVEKAKRMNEGGLTGAAATHLLNQMDPDTREQFRSSYRGDSHPSLEEVAEFFLGKARTWEEQRKGAKTLEADLGPTTSKLNIYPKVEAVRQGNGDRYQMQRKGRIKCYHCQGAHRVADCPRFRQLPPKLNYCQARECVCPVLNFTQECSVVPNDCVQLQPRMLLRS